MEEWLKISLTLSVFGFFKDFRASEAYSYEFFTQFKNLTSEEINADINPIETYTYMVFCVFVFMCTDYLRYKPLITLIGISGVILYALYIWGTSVFAMQIATGFYGLIDASETAYSTYIYAKVSEEHYPRVTSHARAASLMGSLTSALIAQFVIAFHLMNILHLQYLSLGALACATLWSFCLPRVNNSVYTYDKFGGGGGGGGGDSESSTSRTDPLTMLKTQFVLSFSRWSVLKWSIWYVLATALVSQESMNIQNLYGLQLGPGVPQTFNGFIVGAASLCAAASSLLAGALEYNWTQYGAIALGLGSSVAGLTLLLCTFLGNIWVTYAAHILISSAYSFLVTICFAQVAKHLGDDCYGLVFGVNQFVSLVVQSVLIVVVIHCLGIGIFSQFVIYGASFLLLGLVYSLGGLVSVCGKRDTLLGNAYEQDNSNYNTRERVNYT